MPSESDRQTLLALLEAGQLEPYVRHIRFPRFKNLALDTRIDFTFPITALVGSNGTNKSSVLRALQGAPGANNLGNSWFSTSVDPIEETGDRPNCFIYGYKHQEEQRTVEVLKTRIRREDDPDYWEPSRPLVRYAMERRRIPGVKRARWENIRKEVVYVDFRQSLSAFDKTFYQGELQGTRSLRQRKDFIRGRSPKLKQAIQEVWTTFLYYRKERILNEENRTLTKAEVSTVSSILGKSYSTIKWIRHRFFDIDAYTCTMTASDLTYTEAFAGSGEFAVVRLVVEINGARPRSLILLDEPEVSLHPGAQERLVDYLFGQSKQRKHQIIISTHSPAMIRSLPADAIKVLVFDPNLGKVKLPTQAAAAEEAFFYIGEPLPEKKVIVVEDVLSKRIVEKVLRYGGEAFKKIFEIKYFPGGAATLWTQYLPIFSAEGRTDILVILDGDQRSQLALPNPDEVPFSQNAALKSALDDFAKTEIKFYVDGGQNGGDQQQRDDACRALVKWAGNYVDFLPGDEKPEAFLWQHMTHDVHSKGIPHEMGAKEKFVRLTKLALGREDYEDVTAQEIAIVQASKLATITDTLSELQALYARIAVFAGHPIAAAGAAE